jgi:DNA polymerase-1
LAFKITPQHPDWKNARDAIKVYDFGRLLYGGSITGIYERMLMKVPDLGATLADIKVVDEELRESYPVLFEFQDRIAKQVEETCQVANAFGRTRILRGSEHEARREGLNHPIQSTAADIINQAMIRIDNEFYEEEPARECRIVNQLHDELVIDGPTEEIEWGMSVLKSEMERPVKIGDEVVVFPTNGKVGEDWGQLK